MSTYTRLSCEQRYQLSALKKAGHTQSYIAEYGGTSEAMIEVLTKVTST